MNTSYTTQTQTDTFTHTHTRTHADTHTLSLCSFSLFLPCTHTYYPVKKMTSKVLRTFGLKLLIKTARSAVSKLSRGVFFGGTSREQT